MKVYSVDADEILRNPQPPAPKVQALLLGYTAGKEN